ncbi:MAG: lytic transglycosylase domain-containing protein, partial [Solirubrobacterales bacterium]
INGIVNRGKTFNFTIAVSAIVFALAAAMALSISAFAADVTGQSGAGSENPGLVPDGSDPSSPAPTTTPGDDTPSPKSPKVKVPKNPSKNEGRSKSNSDGGSKKKSSSNDNSGSGRDDSKSGDPTAGDPLDSGSVPGDGPISVPNLFLKQFQIPPFLLPIYQAAGIQYGIRWEVLASINEIETNYGRNLNVSSAGALGWMQFMPATWEMYGVDANDDGIKDPYNPADAIFAAAKYLKAAGGDKDIQRAIFSYNHAQWYVDQVMLRAKLIAGVPDPLIDSLTGLTEGHFPVYARSTYKGAVATKASKAKGGNAARVVEGKARRNGVKIFSRVNAPVVAVQDAVVQDIGANTKDGNFITIQDSYGNRYRYANLGSLSKLYPVPRAKAGDKAQDGGENEAASVASQSKKSGPRVGTQERMYAHPDRPRTTTASDNGVAMPGYETFDNYFSRPFGLKKEDVVLKPLKKGSHVIGGTILGRYGIDERHRTPYINFQVRPAGSGAPVIDPKPILDGWKLLESTAIYRAVGVNPLVPINGNKSIGQILLMSKEQLENYVLNTKTIEIYEGGRNDIRAGQIDRRVLALLAFLDSEGYHPTVTCLISGHSYLTSSGNVSEHMFGTAVDIAAINGQSMIENNKPHGLMEEVVRKIMTLQGILEPHQIISLFDLGGATMSLPDHANHIHVGFRPGFGVNKNGKLIGESKNGKKKSILSKRDWYRVFDHLGEIENPEVPTQPSAYAIKVNKHVKQHDGE